jgi:hypothetical protein
VTRAWEAAAGVETARVALVLATETSAQEAAMVQDSTTIHAKDWKTRLP